MKKKEFIVSTPVILLNIFMIGIIIVICIISYNYALSESDISQPPSTLTTTSVSAPPDNDPVVNTTSGGIDAEHTEYTDNITSGEITAPDESAETADVTEPTEPDEPTEVTADEPNTPSVQGTFTFDDLPEFNELAFANDVFIGDSIFYGIAAYAILPDKNVVAQQGMNIAKILDSPMPTHYGEVTAVEAVREAQPDRIFIMLGSNGIAWIDVNTMLNLTKLLVEGLQDVSPDSKIYLVSVPPITKDRDLSKDNESIEVINEYNQMLKDYCLSASIGYIDLFSALIDSEGYFSTEYSEPDGMHFPSSTHRLVLRYLNYNAG